MKTSSKIWVAIISFVWAFLVFCLVLVLCREMDWAIALGEWCTNVWNSVFGSNHTLNGFFARLEDILFLAAIAHAVITVIVIICCVKVNSPDEEEAIEVREKAKKIKKAKEAEVMKKEANAEKGKKKLLKVKKAAKEVKEAAEVVEEAAAKTNEIDNFLARLRQSK